MITLSGRGLFGWLGLAAVLLPGFAWGQDPDLVNYWSFNGSLRDTASSYEQNAGSTATDMARSGGGAVLYGPGRTEGTFAVRTRPNAETYATVLDPDPLVVNQDAKFSPNYTVSVWTKTQAWGRSGWNYLMMDGPRMPTILFQYNSNGSIYFPNGPYVVFPQATQRQWSQLTFVGDAANSQTRLYINGELKATAGYGGLGTPASNTSGYLSIGVTNRSDYNGDIFYQDLAMWNTAKTDAEVASLYTNGYGFSPAPAAPPSVPTLSWGFTETPWDWNTVSGSVGIFTDLSVGRDRGVEAATNELRAGDGIHETLLYRSPAFNLAAGGNLTFNVRGGSGGATPFPQADSDIPLQVDATASGVLGVGLRDVATGQYVLSDTGIGDNLAWKSVIWSPEQLAPFVGAGRSFTLDLVDARSGGWGWLALADVNVPGTLATSAAPEQIWYGDGWSPGYDGEWTDSGANWSGGAPAIPLVPGNRAVFGFPDGVVTIAESGVTGTAGLRFVAGTEYELTGGPLTLGGNSAAANTVIVEPVAVATISAALSGTAGLTKMGQGDLLLSGGGSLSGPVTVAEGTLRLDHAGALASAAVTVAGGTLATSLTTALTGLSVESGQVLLDSTETHALEVGSFTIDLEAGGLVDLGVGRIEIAAGADGAALREALAAGGAATGWNGTAGIVSTAAAATGGSRTVGYLLGSGGSAVLAFAAPGDTNLDGLVDSFDLVTMASSGKYGTGQAAVWAEGDFNYDGVVDSYDLVTMASLGVYGTGNYLPLPTAPVVTAVPEPGSVALLLVVLAGVAGLAAGRRVASGETGAWGERA